MPIDVTEATFESEVVDRSRQLPVVVDFWAEWCGPCRALTPALEAAEAARGGKVVLAKVDTDANQGLAARFGIQGIPAVKAFRDGTVVDEFVGALPPPRVEAFFDALVPSMADELLAKGDELSLREASELEPGRADIAVALGKARLERGAEAEALEAVEGHESDFGAAGIAALIRLAQSGLGGEATEAFGRGDREASLDALLRDLDALRDSSPADSAASDDAPGGAPVTLPDRTDAREDLRRAIVGILSELDPADPTAREYRRKLAAAL